MALTKEDLQAIRALLEPIKADMADLRENLDTVKISQMRVELEQYPRIAAALEGVSGVNEKFHRLDKLEDKQEDHGNRILALEYALKQAK